MLSGRKAVKFVEAIGFAKGLLGPDVDSFLDLRESKEGRSTMRANRNFGRPVE